MTDPRTMTPRLAAALDSLASEGIAVRVLDEEGRGDGTLAALYAALVVELRLCNLRAQDALRGLEAEEQARIDAVDLEVNGPLPQREGEPATFDPDTREWT